MSPLRMILRWAVASVSVGLLLSAAIGIFAVEGALHPARLPISESDRIRAQTIASRSDAALTDVEIIAEDHEVLRGWKMKPLAGYANAVILLHGQGDNRAGMLGTAEMLLRHGYAVLLPDARAHGLSGGLIATYGVIETDDIRRWYAWLDQTESPHCIDGLGESMGAAQILQSVAVETKFCAASAESPFATFQEAAYDRIGQEFGTGPWLGRTVLRPAIRIGLVYARLRYGVDLSRASPANAVVASKVPILLIHGLADKNLPHRHSEMIERADPAAELWEPVGAEHCGASKAEPEEYERRVLGWFESHD